MRLRRLSKAPLSKSRFMKGLQCPLQLWWAVRTDFEPDPITEATRSRFAMGHRVGALAQRRFPGGVLITEDHLHHAAAVASTRAALDEGADVLYEAAFTHQRTKVRVDVLRRLDDGTFEVVEVKSAGSYKPKKHLMDVAVQVYVVRGAGLEVSSAKLMHIDKDYVWDGGAYDPSGLFALADVTGEVFEVLPQIPPRIDDMLAMLASDEPPELPADVRCTSPYDCAFLSRCAADAPEHPISELPGCGRNTKLRAALEAAGLVDVREIDESTAEAMPREDQRHTWRATVEARLLILDAAREWAADLAEPVMFLDFETVNPTLPLYVGTSPFQVIPVQWSLHVLRADGEIEHHEYLARGREDPSEEFARTLLDALGEEGSVLHYTDYEKRVLRSLAERVPAESERIGRVLDRCRDLAKPVAKGCFHPDVHGRYSIKYVLPVLAPGLPPYASLAVPDGESSMLAFTGLLDEGTPATRRAEIERDLLEYCRQDTLGMVEVYRVLRG